MARTTRSLALLLALSACIPDLGGGADEIAIPRAVAGAQAGGTLRVAVPATDSIDPGLVTYERTIASAMCDQLVMADPATGELRPGLARSWTITDSGRRLFVRLRPEARFHDGSPVRADDVVFTLSRLANRDFAAPAASLLAPVVGFGQMHGDVAVDELPTRLAGVRAADDLTVEIEFAEPFADFPAFLAHPATSPVPRAAATEPGFDRAPVCAGPYRLARPFEPGERVVLVRADAYAAVNPAFSAGGRGYAERIVFETATSREEEAALFRRGRVDAARAPLDGPLADNARATRSSHLRFVGFPTSVAPYDDVVVRRALYHAIDGPRLIARANRVWRDATPGAPAPARELRARLADTDLGSVRLRFIDEGDNGALATRIARDWRRIGLDVRLVPMGFEAFLALGRSTTGFDGPFLYAWEPLTASPESTLTPLFDDSGIGLDNLSRFDDAAFADALRAARRTIEPDARAGAYARVAARVFDQVPMAILAWAERSFLIRRATVASARPDTAITSNGPVLRELYLRR